MKLAARLLVALLVSSLSFAQAAPQTSPLPKKQPTPITAGAEARTAKYFERIKSDPLALREFLVNFPKGADLHNHMSGAIYAESYVQWAAEDGWCVDKQSLNIVRPRAPEGSPADTKATCDKTTQREAKDALTDPALYTAMIDVMSMRNWDVARKPGQAQFFDTFTRFSPLAASRVGDNFAESLKRGAQQNLHYLELMIQLDGGKALNPNPKLEWKGDTREHLDAAHAQLASNGLFNEKRSSLLDRAEARMKQVLKCGTPEADKGCDIPLRYQCQVLRARTPDSVFAQIAFCFELIQTDPRVVSLNLVQPEDWLIPVRDYELHMRMIDYFYGKFPKTRITLHAGELTFGQVPPHVLGYHVPMAIDQGHAKRIGHGTDVMYHPDAQGILAEMKLKDIAVEISPSSSKYILGVTGKNHPFRHYMKAGVAVAISTDDEGVARSDITNEYQQAVEQHNLTYAELKKISRDSLKYGFLDDAAKKAEQGKLEHAFREFEKKWK